MFQGLRSLNIPEGDVIKIELDGITLWEAVRLPDEYQEVEWIQANANVGAYIDLGFSYDKGATINLGYWVMNDNNTYPFGATENNGELRCCLSLPYTGNGESTGSFYYTSKSTGKYNNKSINYNKNVENQYVFTLKEDSILLVNKTTENENQSQDLASITMTNNLYLFAQNYNGTARFGDIRRISYFRYYNNDGVLICDMIPCYRKSDNTIGMYDLARKQFFTNIGTGTFVIDKKYIDSFVAKNWVNYSTESDGVTIYNGGLGYKDGSRVRSGGTEASEASSVCTGFIPFKPGDTLRIYPPFEGGNTTNTINFSDANFNNLGQVTDSGSYYGICLGKTFYKSTIIDGVSTLTYTNQFDSQIQYIRVTQYNKHLNEFVITINEEIIL